MKQSIISIIAVLLVATLLTGCNMKNRDVGTIAGGAVGAGVGYAVSGNALGTVIGATAGGVGGHYIGKSTE